MRSMSASASSCARLRRGRSSTAVCIRLRSSSNPSSRSARARRSSSRTSAAWAFSVLSIVVLQALQLGIRLPPLSHHRDQILGVDVDPNRIIGMIRDLIQKAVKLTQNGQGPAQRGDAGLFGANSSRAARAVASSIPRPRARPSACARHGR